MGQRVSERHRRAVRRRTSTRSTCCCTASASRWPRRSPSTGTAASARSGASPTRTGPTLAGLFRQQYRGGRYSWGYPACPDLEDNVKVAELLDAEPHRHRGQRGDGLPVPARADHLGASSATTPRPSTSSPADCDQADLRAAADGLSGALRLTCGGLAFLAGALAGWRLRRLRRLGSAPLVLVGVVGRGMALAGVLGRRHRRLRARP